MFIAGKWYVFFPNDFGDSPQGGPFETEEQAWRWLTLVSVLDDGEVWQCPANPPGRTSEGRVDASAGTSTANRGSAGR